MALDFTIPDGFDKWTVQKQLRHYANETLTRTAGSRRFRAALIEAAGELDLADSQRRGDLPFKGRLDGSLA